MGNRQNETVTYALNRNAKCRNNPTNSKPPERIENPRVAGSIPALGTIFFEFHLGNNDSKPFVEASATPRSVIRPVTSRAGVTSKAGFPAGVCIGEMRTRAMVPAASSPCT